MPLTVGLMGFGRIGRNLFRILHRREDIRIVAISDIADHSALEYLLRFDTVLGRFPEPVRLEGDTLRAGSKSVKMLSGRDPGDVDWKALGVDYVVEAAGRQLSREMAARHLGAGARHVILCVPPLDEPDITCVFGVNEALLTPAHRIISNGSCTLNAVAPVARLLQESFVIRQGFLTTVHAYTADQRLADVPAEDLRRSRAAAENIIPTDTRSHRMLMGLIPALADRLGGIAVNVPVPDGSIVDLVVQLERPATVASVNELVRGACAGPLHGFIEYEEDPIVSSDVILNPHSGVFDALSTQALGEDLFRVLIWFENGWGYASRVADLMLRLDAVNGGEPGRPGAGPGARG